MKASYINLGKTATKALLITQDISFFIVSLLLAWKRVTESKHFRGIHNFSFFHLTIRGTDSRDYLPSAKNNPFPISNIFSPDLLFDWFNTHQLIGHIACLLPQLRKTHVPQQLLGPLDSRLVKEPLRKSYKALYKFHHNEVQGDGLMNGGVGNNTVLWLKPMSWDPNPASTTSCLGLKSLKAS